MNSRRRFARTGTGKMSRQARRFVVHGKRARHDHIIVNHAFSKSSYRANDYIRLQTMREARIGQKRASHKDVG